MSDKFRANVNNGLKFRRHLNKVVKIGKNDGFFP